MSIQTPECQIVSQRVERLERQNRRLKEVGVLALGLIGTLLLIGRGLAKNRIVGANPLMDLGAAGSLLSSKSAVRWQERATGVSQSNGSYPTRTEVITALKDADYALRRFEEAAGQVNFSRWDVGHERVDASQRNLEAALGKARRTKARIEEIQAGKAVSGLDLFQVYDGLVATDTTASELGDDLLSFDAKRGNLASELFNVATLGVKASSDVRDVFWKQIQAEESELEACHSKPQAANTSILIFAIDQATSQAQRHSERGLLFADKTHGQLKHEVTVATSTLRSEVDLEETMRN